MIVVTPQSTLTKVSGTTAYDVGDLIANSATAGSVTPFEWSMSGLGRSGMIRRVRIYKSTTTTTAASFTLHLFATAPTVANGDNGAFAVSAGIGAGYLGSVALDMSSGAEAGSSTGLADVSATIAIGVSFPTSGASIYGLLEAVGAYAPGSNEVFTITLEIEG
jgi:hypothetical protein